MDVPRKFLECQVGPSPDKLCGRLIPCHVHVQPAYDGSTEDAKRDLTPFERDVICRVLLDIKHHLGRAADEKGHIDMDKVDLGPIRGFDDQDEINMLFIVPDVLTPRETL